MKSSVKLKASDIYSDDSGSDSEDKPSVKRSSSSSRSSSDSEEESANEIVTGKQKIVLLSNIFQLMILYSKKTGIHYN